MKIVNIDKDYLDSRHITELKKHGDVIIYTDIPSEAEAIRRISDADILITSWLELPKSLLIQAKKLKYITIAATGYSWVDIEAARERAIPVSNAPYYSTEAVAEHTISLLLQATRLASKAERDARMHIWENTLYKGKELKGKTLGIIGYGAIGKRVGEIAAKGFGMQIISIDSKSTRADLEQLLQQSDCLSINAQLTHSTKQLLSQKEFAFMKDDVIIVNTGSGQILDQQALITALKKGKVFAAALDVYEKEPLPEDDALRSFDNVTLTPHIAYNTKEAQFALSKITMENVLAFLKGKPQNVINE